MTRTSRRCSVASRSGSCRTAWSTVSETWICDPTRGQILRSVGLSARSPDRLVQPDVGQMDLEVVSDPIAARCDRTRPGRRPWRPVRVPRETQCRHRLQRHPDLGDVAQLVGRGLCDVDALVGHLHEGPLVDQLLERLPQDGAADAERLSEVDLLDALAGSELTGQERTPDPRRDLFPPSGRDDGPATQGHGRIRHTCPLSPAD
jgi:hypothetical protein